MSHASHAHFNADAVRAAQEEPTLIVGNLLFRGRLLSIEEWMVHAERFDAVHVRAARGETVPPHELLAMYRAYLRDVFPRKRYRWWAPDPVARLLRQPWGVVQEAAQSFFVLQARAMAPRPIESPTSTTASAASIPATETPVNP